MKLKYFVAEYKTKKLDAYKKHFNYKDKQQEKMYEKICTHNLNQKTVDISILTSVDSQAKCNMNFE